MVCKAYTEGLLVGCHVTDDYEPCSMKFKNDVALCIEPLIESFKKIGAKEAQEFHYLINTKKAVVDEDISDKVNKKRKDTESCEYLPWNVFAHRDCVVTDVLIKCPTWVEKGQPLYAYDVMKPKEVIMPLSTKLERSAFEMILEENHSSHIGIFSMEDVLVDLQDIAKTSRRWKGLLHHDEVNKRYENFKKFDFVSDHTDHYFSAPSFAINQPSNDWVNKIHEEWRILEGSLPDTILVRTYKSRMDLLRAVILGPEGTPYHGGLFFFDVCFPSNYPHSLPLMHYHSGGLDINPNLSKCGKVRLSLPNRFGGHETIWVPGSSTMLRLLTIQNWYLNSDPLFNDLTYAITGCSKYAQHYSFRYNENIRIKTLKTMVHTMNNPTKNFEEFIPGHFCKYARDILTTLHQNNHSVTYGNNLFLIIWPLMDAFRKMGANKSQLAISGKE